MKHIFRAYDVRGIFNEELTPEMATRIGMAFGTYLDGNGTVLVGRDVRVTSKIIENAFTAGLAATGVDVVSTGLVPIPVANFKTGFEDYDAGGYITASHNPPEYNGVRLRRSDGSGYTEENQDVWKIFLENLIKLPKWSEIGTINYIDEKETVDKYKNYLLDRIGIDGEVKAVLDIGNGATYYTAPLVLREAGSKVVTINEKPDGTFPGRPSEPSNETLGELQRKVAEENADFGAGYDGDGDRVIFVDNKGRTVQTEKIGIVISRDILKGRKGNIIANVSCSMIVEDEIEKIGGKVFRVRVGDVFVCEAIKDRNALFAMETSAHFFMPEYYIFDDPILVTLKLAEILSKSDKTLAEMADEIPSYPFKEKNFRCDDRIKFKVVEEVIESFNSKGYDVDLTDGAKVIFDDGWILLRPSNTTPLIRAAVEARSERRLKELVELAEKEFEGALSKCR